MRHSIMLLILVLSALVSKAHNIISLKTGETHNAQVFEDGINKFLYNKSDNSQGSLYAALKTVVVMIVYKNRNKDIFTSSLFEQQQSNTVIVERPVRRRNYWKKKRFYPLVITHTYSGHHGGYYRIHHGRHH